MTKTTAQESAATLQKYSDAELTLLANAFKTAWAGVADQPAQNIDGFGAGVQPRLPEYGVLVAIAFEDEGFDDAFEMVVANRPQVECAWDLGIEPAAFVNHLISNR